MYICNAIGGLAHLARARHWQCRGDRFESGNLHKKASANADAIFFVEIISVFYYVPTARRPEGRLLPSVTHKSIGKRRCFFYLNIQPCWVCSRICFLSADVHDAVPSVRVQICWLAPNVSNWVLSVLNTTNVVTSCVSLAGV